MPIGQYPVGGGWLTRANGASDTLDLTGKYLISATIQWKGLQLQGSEISASNSKSGSLHGYITNDLAMPGVPAECDFTKQEIYARAALDSYRELDPPYNVRVGLKWPGGSMAYYYPLTNTISKTLSRTSYGTGTASLYSYCKYTGSYSHSARTFGKVRLYTKNPRATVSGSVTEQTGDLKGTAETTAKKLNGLQSNAVNTISHGCSPYSDAQYGSSGQLQFRIEYEYIEYPDVLTLSPENIGHSSARLRYNLQNAGGGDVVMHFDYGETEDYGESIEVGVVSAGQGYADVFDLEVNTLYQHRARAVATKASPYHGSTWTLISYGINREFEPFAGPPSVQTITPDQITATGVRLRGNILSTGGIIPERYFEYGKTTAYELGSISKGPGDVGEYTHSLVDLDFDTSYFARAYGISDGTLRGNGAQVSFATLYPYLAAPTGTVPASGAEVSDRRPYFSFALTADAVNPATLYHARLRISASIDIEGQHYLLSESRFDDGWEAWIDDEWVTFPAGGVAPDTLVRVRPVDSMRYGPNYWDCASWDGDGWNDPAPGRYGLNASPRVLRLRLVVTGGKPYELMIDGQEWLTLDTLRVSEAANGEIGLMEFTLDNEMSTNLLSENQSSAETDLTGFTAVTGTIERSYDYALHGDISVKVTPVTTTGEVHIAEVEVSPGQFYTASLSALSAAAPNPDSTGESGVYRLRLVEIDDADAVIGYTDSPLYGGLRGWNRLQVTREFSSEGVKARIELRGVKSPALDAYYIDCQQLEPGERVTAWKLGGVEVYADEIPFGAQVTLAVIDTLGNSEEFAGRVRWVKPRGDIVEVTAILGDGFLGERLVKTDYPTNDVAKDIDSFEPGDDGLVTRTEITAADWADSFDQASLMTVNNDLTLAAISDYLYYNSGTEGVDWVVGYSTGGGSQSKDATNLYLNTIDEIYTGGIRTYVTDDTVDLTDIAKLKVDFAVIMGPEINFGTVRWGPAVNKMDANFVLSRTRSSNLGRTTWEIDVSALTGAHYIKLLCGHETASNISGRFYRVWGEDENGRTVAEYENTGYRVSQPLDLSVVTNVFNSRIEWDASIPSGASLVVECGVNSSAVTEPETWNAATSGDPIPGITAEDDLSGKYLWVKTSFTSNLTRTLSPLLAYLSYIVYDDGHFGVIVECPGHEYNEGDTVLIEGDNHYNGTWEIGVVDMDNFVIDTVYIEQIAARGTSKYVEDIGIYFQHMINTYCRPLTADDFVDVDTGFKAPIKANGRYAVAVAEDLRRIYDLHYFVDADYRVHLFKREAIVQPDPYFYLRAGESKILRGES